MLLGSPDQPSADHLHVKHRLILIGGYARIYARGQVCRVMLVKVTGARGLTCALTGTWSIVRKCNVFGRVEGLRVARKPRRKRGGTSTCPITGADAPNVVWAIDFQFGSMRCAVGHR
jgi:hypothetical protein